MAGVAVRDDGSQVVHHGHGRQLSIGQARALLFTQNHRTCQRLSFYERKFACSENRQGRPQYNVRISTAPPSLPDICSTVNAAFLYD